MPSGYLHKHCALKASERAGVVISDLDAYILGAQGPDPLFMLGLFPLRLKSRPSKLGNLLHSTKTGAFLCALCRLAKEGDGGMRAFAMGFLTHYALDSTVHPFVYAHSVGKDGKYSSPMHVNLEKHWDSLYYQRESGRGTSVIMPGIKETRARWDAIADHWARAMNEVYPALDITPNTIREALASADRVNRLTHSPRGVKYCAIWIVERVAGLPMMLTGQMAPRRPSRKDIVNAARRTWNPPAAPGVARDEGLGELLEESVARAARLLDAAQHYYEGALAPEAFAEIVGNMGYDTGMTIAE